MKKSLLFLIISSMVLFVSTGVHAVTPENYIVLKAGIYTPTSDDLTSKGADFGTGFNGEVGVGHYFKKDIAGEISAGYAETTSNFYDSDTTIWTFPILVTFKVFYPLEQINPYAEAGGGYYFGRLKTHGNDYDSDGWGVHLGLGFNYDLSKEAFVGLEGRYICVFHDFDAPHGYGDVNGHGFTLSINLGYRF